MDDTPPSASSFNSQDANEFTPLSTCDPLIFYDTLEGKTRTEIKAITNRIKAKLSSDKQHFCVTPSATRTAKYWKIFGHPSQIFIVGEKREVRQIPNFISCQKCFKTFVHSRTSGTSTYNDHKCLAALLAAEIKAVTTSHPSASNSLLASPACSKSPTQQTLTS
ncbi:unnamed protein product [Didymodactylos carnosus]|uniref:Uncharacterized protein n=1 Tax=Didymodactylos carnosus TaxID=1234261 RepID=A0A814TGG3_9BILA|nr:unnamed protein product [Didymodactylos carnosus]CAF3922778.1 unnamed protein product [Didymodactylos carnosus]